MHMPICNVTLLVLLLFFAAIESVSADTLGKHDYMTDCAGCHAVDGKGRVAEMRQVKGYMSVDLTQLSKANGGQFPRQAVYDAIDGRKRFPAHFIGDMPTWGLQYQDKESTPAAQEKVKRRISALVDYIESIQEK
jgi:cytochrome c